MRLAIMRIDRSWEKYSSLFVLGWLTLISYLQARGITRLVEGAIGGGVPIHARAARSRAQTPRRATADAIIERNPFDSAAPSLGRASVSAAPEKLGNGDPLSAPQCESTLAVIVTEARGPAWSVAALQIDPRSRPRDYRIGDHVAGQLVEFIGDNPARHSPSVWLSSASGLCQISLFASRPKLAQSATVAPAVPAVAAPRTGLLSHVRVVPELRDGAILGIRVFGIRPDSLLQLIGLQNGDRLESINGFALGTAAQAFSAYAQLRAAHRVALDIERRGRPLTLAYRID